MKNFRDKKMTSSFVKKQTTRGRPNLPLGTKPSVGNNQLLVSSGIPSLDMLIGGGIAIGTLVMIEEDLHRTYSNVMHKLFLAEGIKCKHSIFVANEETSMDEFIKDIPSCIDDVQKTAHVEEMKSTNTANDDELKIAWRYKNQPTTPKVVSTQFGHYFDLSEPVPEVKLKEVDYTCYQEDETEVGKNGYYQGLLKQITAKIKNQNLFTKDSKIIPPILRIDLSAIGSPNWNIKLLNKDGFDSSLVWFLLALKALLRSSFACAMVSIPSHLFQSEKLLGRLRHCCDIVIDIESLPVIEKHPLSKEYHGTMEIKRMSSLNCINGQNIDTSDLAFKLKKKRFLIEKFHLPPDMGEAPSAPKPDNAPKKSSTPLCGQMTPVNNVLDF
ncbi:elongator complex protein 4-like [Clytia hemisphaerica]|uniref:elongator complex protein 4-like n=1 Tax=Clytia hemisphaerica TaxID=252671 RepID=UPI0034D69D6C